MTSPAATKTDRTPFEQVRAEAWAWIIKEAYNGRKIDDGDFDSHETTVWAPKRDRVDDFTPLPLTSVLNSHRTSPAVEQIASRSPFTPRTVAPWWSIGGLAATVTSVTGVIVFGSAVLDILALSLGALGMHALTRARVGRTPTPTTGSKPVLSSPRWDIGLRPGHNVAVSSFDVVPEIAYVYRFLKEAPARLLGLNADTEAIASAERAWETALREISRLPDEAFIYKGKSHRLSNGQKGTVAHTRIMEAGAEILLMVRAAEETEYALAPQSPTPMGPWSQLSTEPVVVDMLNRAQSAQDLSPRLT